MQDLQERLELHRLWLTSDPNGKRFVAEDDDSIQVDLREANLTGTNLSKAKLSLVNLSGVDLSFTNLSHANLRGADLRWSNLIRADLRGADLRGANLAYVDLKGANLEGADLRRVDFSGADLECAKLEKVDLRGADLTSVKLKHSSLDGADLRGVHMLGTMGDGEYIISALLQPWTVVYTHDTLQIGCKRKSIEWWRKATPGDVAGFEYRAESWWTEHKDHVIGLVDAFPAKPTKPC